MSKSFEVSITGMTCAACSARIEKKLARTSGVESVSVNLATEKASVRIDNTKLDEKNVREVIHSLGYGTIDEKAKEKESEHKQHELVTLKRTVIASVILSSPLVIAMIFSLLGINNSLVSFFHLPLVQFILATPVQFVIGARYYRGTWHDIKSGSLGMDVLVAMGTSAAYFFSVYNGFFVGGHAAHQLYFEASAVVITLVLLGKYFETRAKGRASDAIRKLMELAPKVARVKRGDVEIEVPLEQLVPGDIIIVYPGDRVPVDGKIIEGFSTIDESMLTGESIPVDKTVGDVVIGGTINKFGSFTYTATKVGADTLLAHIIKVVEQAQGSKAPVQRLADEVSGVFVPVVLVIALITLFGWWLLAHRLDLGLINAVAVLVISCPCALGLATPTAIMVGTGIGANRGILIKNGESLEKICRVSTIVFDKTGTLTKGRPELTDIISFGSYSRDDLLMLAAAAEKRSEHPLARAIVSAAEKVNPVISSPEAFEAVPGKGISAVVSGRAVLVGTPVLMAEKGIALSDNQEQIDSLAGQGKTSILVAVDNRLEGVLGLADTVKDSARTVVDHLKHMGKTVVMLTGDNQATAQFISGELGIDKVIAGVLPDQKAAHVSSLKQNGNIVAMVGDGINDAPALSTADVGIALGSGTDIAMESADMTIINGDIRVLPVSIILSEKTMSRIRQNLFWAFFYNVVGIPLAAFGMLNPVIAGAAMAFSSVSVVTNSLRLKRANLN